MTQIRPGPVRGLFDDVLWQFAEQGELRLQQCKACGQVRYLPGPVCPACLSEDYCWARMGGTGKIMSWCVFHKQYFPEMPTPYAVILVSIPEGPVLAGNILDCPVEDLRIDMPVTVSLEPVIWSDGRGGRLFQMAARRSIAPRDPVPRPLPPSMDLGRCRHEAAQSGGSLYMAAPLKILNCNRLGV